jgi:hypothetical protein
MALTTVNPALLDTQAQYTGFKNRIINGAMVIDQRNAGASVTPSVLFSTYTLDRWNTVYSVGSKFSVQQNAGSVTPPAGFRNYLGVTSLSAYTPGSAEQYTLVQNIEGLNVADFGWGTASAATVTLSFWVRSSLTGTFGGVLGNSAANRTYPFTYTISAANTWELKTITIPGDTSGTWLTTNGIGMQVIFSLGAGSTLLGTAGAWSGSTFTGATGQTNIVATNGATFYITGVQLEKGTQATSFDYRPYGTELALCQRYYWKGGYGWNGIANSTTTGGVSGTFPVPMRAAPTMGFVPGLGTNALLQTGGSNTNLNNVASQGANANGSWLYYTLGSYTSGGGYQLVVDLVTASAEL